AEPRLSVLPPAGEGRLMPGYRADVRSESDVVAQLGAAARSFPLPRSLARTNYRTWADLIFDDGGLRDQTEPSQTVLWTLARLHAGSGGLVDHLDTLPAAARTWYLEQRLGIDRLRPIPDHVHLLLNGD